MLADKSRENDPEQDEAVWQFTQGTWTHLEPPSRVKREEWTLRPVNLKDSAKPSMRSMFRSQSRKSPFGSNRASAARSTAATPAAETQASAEAVASAVEGASSAETSVSIDPNPAVGRAAKAPSPAPAVATPAHGVRFSEVLVESTASPLPEDYPTTPRPAVFRLCFFPCVIVATILVSFGFFNGLKHIGESFLITSDPSPPSSP